MITIRVVNDVMHQKGMKLLITQYRTDRTGFFLYATIKSLPWTVLITDFG